MLLRLSIVMFVATLAIAEIPSYIKICGRRNPKLGKCLKRSVMGLRDKLKEGISELQVPPLEPLSLEGFTIFDTEQLKAKATNAKLYGLTNFGAKNLKIRLTAQKIDIEVFFKNLTLNADSNFEAQSMKGNGPISITTRGITVKVTLNFQLENIERLENIHPITTELTVMDYVADLTQVKGDHITTQVAINVYMAAHRREMFALITRILKEKISEKIFDLTNKICSRCTYDELFPDSE